MRNNGGKGKWVAATAVLGGLAVVLSAAVTVQAVMLHAKGWRLQFGTLPDWVAGVGTLGAFMAAFGALTIAVREWRAGQEGRRDQEAEQARLIIAEPVDTPRSVSPNRSDVVVRNHSAAPVFNVGVESIYITAERYKHAKIFADHGVELERSGAVSESSRPVLKSGQATSPISIDHGDKVPGIPHVEFVTFTFTDAHGRWWRRMGTKQPERLLTEPNWLLYKTDLRALNERLGPLTERRIE